MHSQRYQRQQTEDAHSIVAEQTLPFRIGQTRVEQQITEHENRVGRQQHGADALRHPVIQAAGPHVGDAGYHIHTPTRTIKTAATTITSVAPSRPLTSPSPTPASTIRWRIPATR